METMFFLYAFALFLEVTTLPSKLDESFARCAESCLKINPYNLILDDPDPSGSPMVKHCAKLTADGKCECDWEKLLTPSGTCVCVNPKHKINESNNCVCDPEKCDPQTTCDNQPALAKMKDDDDPFGCCRSFSCESCPNDSYRSNQTQDERCLCYPCKPPTCGGNQTTVIIRQGNKKPGTCCDLYKCEELNQTKRCVAGEEVYADGESWVQGGCTLYRCEKGVIFHEILEGCLDERLCFSQGTVYEHEQWWMEDECTNCTCNNGQKKCVAHFCKEMPSATIRPQQDCPPLAACRKTCAFGFRLNRRGCETCKCRQPDAKEILRAWNCTVENCDVIQLPTSNCSKGNYTAPAEHCPKCAESYSHVLPAILVGIIVFLVVLVAALLAMLCRERRRALYIHIPRFDANLNTEKPMLCKKPTVELKDFR